ncbi:MAG: CinA family protein [Pseudomonadota bacterium]
MISSEEATVFDAKVIGAARDLVQRAQGAGIMIATAESCTGGLIAAALTEVAGSSAVFDRGFLTYSNEAKAELLGVDPSLITSQGAVSGEVAIAMAHGARTRSNAQISVAVTGVAGPGGGSAAKPVGLVHLATSHHVHGETERAMRYGDIGRSAVRLATVVTALEMLHAALEAG